MTLDLDIPNRVVTLQSEYTHPQELLATSQGNVQVLDESGHIFVGWGHSAAFSEYTPDGELLCNVNFGASAYFTFGTVTTYRAVKGDWVGRPHTLPAAEIVDNSIYVSWNGATEVITWRLEVWDNQDMSNMTFDPSGEFQKDGFETEVELPDELHSPYFRLAALDSDGNVLGLTEVLRKDPGWTVSDFFATYSWDILVVCFLATCCLPIGAYWGWVWRQKRRRSPPKQYQLVASREDEEEAGIYEAA